MPMSPTPAQSDASRHNGVRSAGPVTAAGKARSVMNGVRHGLCGRTFFLLPDEDPAEFHEHEAVWLAAWAPRDLFEHEAAAAAIRAMWREIRADRLEVAVLDDLFGAGRIADEAERAAAKDRAFKALATLLRYRGRIEREHRQAMAALEGLRQRRRARPPAARPDEPDEGSANVVPAVSVTAAEAPATSRAALRSEPERPLNRHQRRALAAMERQGQRRAA
jgi:hypothetical protein